jgi:effector-binding domain-containing protein
MFSKFLYVLIVIVLLASCSSPTMKEKEQDSKLDSLSKIAVKKEYTYQLIYGSSPGIVGVKEIPEMLALCLMDSAKLKNMSGKVEEVYGFLQKDLADLSITSSSIPGQIIYNNDSLNFKFECFQLINKAPEQQPKKSNVVILEAEQMLVYNYYGLYQNLPKAYLEVLSYVKKNKLKQVGPFREYYVTDPTKEPDAKNG